MDLTLAEETTNRILAEQRQKYLQKKRRNSGKMSISNLNNRPSNLNSEDFDLNDRSSGHDLISMMQQPFQKEKNAASIDGKNSSFASKQDKHGRSSSSHFNSNAASSGKLDRDLANVMGI